MLSAGRHVAARVNTETMQRPGPDAKSVQGCWQADSGNITLWYTAQLLTATQ